MEAAEEGVLSGREGALSEGIICTESKGGELGVLASWGSTHH